MEFVCNFCGHPYQPNPKATNQKYCQKSECKKKRRADWQKKMEQDQDYRENQALAYENWKRRNPNYWKEYRNKNPEYTKNNRLLQKYRNLRRRQASKIQGRSHKEIAKMDSREKKTSISPGYYKLTPVSEEDIANMEGIIVKIEII